MRKIIIITILFLFLGSCSIDWNNGKENEIIKLNTEIDDLKVKILDYEKKNTDLEYQILELKDNKNFENNLKCQEMGEKLRKQYENIFSIYYNQYANTCYVKYFDRLNNNSLEEGPVDSFGPTNN